ncbi:MgtC/SapB family protein [Azorhizobium doebereinerae]|uniref:MgtC/SapB family protein n=1 Tax=Azorhizobium doebereinerae TaxID=281091 RepID=UPI00042A4062|nr:DUF4010 domain-containing protein [Azorhizobium doebereinerae]
MQDLLVRLAIALGIGLLVGVERGWRTRKWPGGSRAAGVRTYALCGLSGGVFAAVSQALGGAPVLVAGFLVFAAVFTVFSLREMRARRQFSATGLVAALLVFALGALAVVGDARVAGACGIVVAGLLASREMLHGLVRRLTWVELRSALVLLGMTVIVLPLLPDRAIDPFNSVNPREIWLFTVLTAAISYAGYVSIKVAGPQVGIVISALAGAVVSSTSVTIAFARRAKAGDPVGLLAGGAALAAMVSLLRVLTLLALVAPALLAVVAPPTLAAAAVFALGAVALMRRREPGAAPGTEPGNPFELQSLLVFAAVFAAVCALSGWLLQRVGTAGLLVISAVIGIVDVDVATLNAARLPAGTVAPEAAGSAILAALLVNGLARVVFGVAGGTPGYALRLLLVSVLAGLAGGGVLLALRA